MPYLKNPRLLECIFVFVILPPLFAVLKMRAWMHVLLWGVALVTYYWLKRNNYSFKKDWNRAALDKTRVIFMLARYLPLTIILGIFTFIMVPENLFNLPLQRPERWVLIIFLYPILSVIPQEIIFRSFFFRRYSGVFLTERSMILASALTFGWVHILLLNWVAVTFSALGGLIFANTYSKTKSLAAAWLEHAVYGCTVFTLGLGYYFFHGQAAH